MVGLLTGSAQRFEHDGLCRHFVIADDDWPALAEIVEAFPFGERVTPRNGDAFIGKGGAQFLPHLYQFR